MCRCDGSVHYVTCNEVQLALQLCFDVSSLDMEEARGCDNIYDGEIIPLAEQQSKVAVTVRVE